MIGCLRRFGPFLGVQSFLFSEKLIYLGMKIFFFWGGGGRGHHKIGLVLGVISMYSKVLLMVNVQHGNIFGGCKNFKKKIYGA